MKVLRRLFVVSISGLIMAVPKGMRAQATTAADSSASTKVYFEFQVTKLARMDPNSPGPRYPEALRAAGVEGRVTVTFVVDTTGHAEPASMKIINRDPPNPEFVAAVRDVLPQLKYSPGELNGRKVRQLVPQTYNFNIRR